MIQKYLFHLKINKYFAILMMKNTILTKIIGKAIGLIGKGILQGLGRSNSK